MMPEQVWDEADMPEASLRLGQPAGLGGAAGVGACGVPEAAALGGGWEGLRPHRSGLRAVLRAGRQEKRGGTWRFTAADAAIQKIAAGNTLRILDEKRFEVVWSADGWQTTHTTVEPQPGQRGIQRGHRARGARPVARMDPALAGAGRLAWIQCGREG
jgi:hypothetical protein